MVISGSYCSSGIVSSSTVLIVDSDLLGTKGEEVDQSGVLIFSLQLVVNNSPREQSMRKIKYREFLKEKPLIE